MPCSPGLRPSSLSQAASNTRGQEYIHPNNNVFLTNLLMNHESKSTKDSFHEIFVVNCLNAKPKVSANLF